MPRRKLLYDFQARSTPSVIDAVWTRFARLPGVLQGILWILFPDVLGFLLIWRSDRSQRQKIRASLAIMMASRSILLILRSWFVQLAGRQEAGDLGATKDAR